MATAYRRQVDFDVYRHHQWPTDKKPACAEENEMAPLDEKVLGPTPPGEGSTEHGPQSRHPFSIRSDLWHDPSQQMSYHSSQQQVHASMPMIDTSCTQYQRVDTAQEGAYGYHAPWPASAMSTTSTSTTVFDHSSQEFQPMVYPGDHMDFNPTPYSADAFSATPMSPQSSQGGCMSTTSSDGTEPRSRTIQSPDYCPASPASPTRPDGVRKKNARFEIPAERNLANIDSLILQAADEHKKKELKQQKRLLRNRQAALDSRQRKKLHTEKLEQEKKDLNQHLGDLQDENRHLSEAIQQEAARRHRQQQEFEHFVQGVSFERDEAIRTKTVETAELRRMNKILKDHIRDYERREYQRQASSQGNHQAGFSNESSSLDELDVGDSAWEDNFLAVGNEIGEGPNEITPTPSRQSANKPIDDCKLEAPFSWNAFYMCLLFGAFIASNSGSNSKPAVPSLSEEYRVESANVLKAVLTAGPDEPASLAPSPPNSRAHVSPPQAHVAMPATISGLEMAHMTGGPRDNLGALHHSLITPSRRQQETAAFSLSAASYQHLTNPDPLLSAAEVRPDVNFEAKPSRLEAAFNAMQESNQEIDKVMNRGLSERGHMWERVPEKVLRDFRRMVEDADMGH